MLNLNYRKEPPNEYLGISTLNRVKAR